MKTSLNFKKLISLIILFPYFFMIFPQQINDNIETNSNNCSSNKISTTNNDNIFNYSIEQISMGNKFSGAIISDENNNDQFYTWGNNEYGQLGLGIKFRFYSPLTTPEKVELLPWSSNIEQISMGLTHGAAIVNDGSNDYLYTWGENRNGQLGLDKTIFPKDNYWTPQELEMFSETNIDIKQISLGNDNSAAIINNGISDVLYTWGNNSEGKLGLGDNHNESTYDTPQEVSELPKGNVEQISLGGSYSAAVVNDGTGDSLYTWGLNGNGQLGLDNITNYNTPQEVKTLPKGEIKQISMSTATNNEHSAAIVNDGENDHLYTWGANESGQLGLGNNETYKTPQEVTTLPEGNIEQISLGNNHSAAVVNYDGLDHLYTWGENGNGQLGLGNNQTYKTPQEVKTLPEGNIKQLDLGSSQSAIIINNGISDQLYTWGNNDSGQLGLGEVPNESVSTPQLVWETPYLAKVEVNEEFSPSSNFTEVSINYQFETNYEVKDSSYLQGVEIKLIDSKTYKEKKQIDQTKQKEQVSNLNYVYSGSITFSDLKRNQKYTYVVTLNYVDYFNNPQKQILEKEFKNDFWYFSIWFYFIILFLSLLLLFIIIMFIVWWIRNRRIII